jgi:hypothetical protein
MWIANDQYIYFLENQLWMTPGYHLETDRRAKPHALYRVPTVDGGKSVTYVDVGQRVKDVDNRRLEEFQCL